MTDYRKDFPLLLEIGENTVDGREWIYIDNAATSQRPQCVICLLYTSDAADEL